MQPKKFFFKKREEMLFKNKHNKAIKQTTWLKKLFKLLHLQSLTLDSLFGTE